MSDIAAELAIILSLLVVNGLFSMSEIAVVTARRARLEPRADDGDAGARAALDLAAEPTQFLSTVQVGITLIGVLTGAFGGARLAGRLEAPLATVPWIAPHQEAVALTIVVAAITYLSLIVGELVPKRIGLGHPERIARLVSRPMRLVATVGSPLVRLLTASTDFVLRVLGIRASSDPGVTEEEIRALVEQGAEIGEVQHAEREIVDAVFRLGDQRVLGIMTPRTEMDWVDVDAPDEELRQALLGQRRRSFVVCDGQVDRVLGIVLAEDLLARAMGGERIDAAALRASLRQPLFVPATMPVYRLLEHLRASRQHVALALDEYGGIHGIVTLDDILSALVGEFPAEGEQEAQSIVRRDDGSWLVDGLVPLDELESTFDLDDETLRAEGRYHTLGGFVLAQLGHVPHPGERFDFEGLRFEVLDMDGRRVDKVLVTRLARPDGE